MKTCSKIVTTNDNFLETWTYGTLGNDYLVLLVMLGNDYLVLLVETVSWVDELEVLTDMSAI